MAHIELLEAGVASEFIGIRTEGGDLAALDGDPQLIFKPEDAIEPGWYRIDLAIKTSEHLRPQVYFDFGGGFSEVFSTRLRPNRRGKGYFAIVRLPFPVLIVRLDPTEVPCEFTLSSFRFRRQAPHERALVLGRQGLSVMRRHPRAFLRHLPIYLKALRRSGFLRIHSAIAEGDQSFERTAKVEYVSLLDAQPLAIKLARVICFYLPQFHAIPENDKWWGKGFTEWTNVKPTKPRFVGHYQPHVPGELGYYNLLDKNVQRRQIELAKLYGVEGFCFYFYWFNGKRLLEKPVEAWLADASLDLPFCLCWANENWSRRWDGLDKEILIAQSHSPEDDLDFIAEVAKYMTDARYIRLAGKPLLLIYRPNLLPDAKGTAARWRRWCRENGIGEIFLAYTQSFESENPDYYGFDAAVEFPPNNSRPSNVTHTVKTLRGAGDATVYDWRELASQIKKNVQPHYKLFRSVCPGWDNSARRKTGASVLIHNTPVLYRRWLESAVIGAFEQVEEPSQRLVFVNAWNEWAEGAHLEPDAATGYAYLQATRDALENAAWNFKQCERGNKRVAVVIHSFYTDVLKELLEEIDKIPKYHKLFVTTVAEEEDNVVELLNEMEREFTLQIVENRGRDVLPFLKIFPKIQAEGFEFVLKVHTKKSPHRGDGHIWRRDLYRQLLDRSAFQHIIEAFKSDTDLGIVGPDGHFVPMSTYIGSNHQRILSIGRRLGIDVDQIYSQGFFAGTMFIARTSALSPLVNLGFSDDDFEKEEGQIDGTLAHALERGVSLSAIAAGMKVVTASDLSSNAALNSHYRHA